MRSKIFTTLLALALISCANVIARAQDEDEAVRGSFLTTRHKTASSSSKSKPTSDTTDLSGGAATTSSSNAASAAITAAASKVASNTSSGRGNRTKGTSGRMNGSMSVKGSTGRTSASVKA